MKKFLLAFLLTGAVVAQSSLVSTLVTAPPDNVLDILQQHKSELNRQVFVDLLKSSIQEAAQGHLQEGIRRARLADMSQVVAKDTQSRGAGETYLGAWLLKQNRTTDAQTVAMDLVNAHPGLLRGHILLGNVYVAEGRGQDAVKELEPVVNVAPKLYRAHMVLAKAYQQVGRQADAQREFRVAGTLKPNSPEAEAGGEDEHFTRAEAAFQAKQYDVAAEEYGKALEDDPTDVKAAIYQGDSYSHVGKNDDALACFKHAVQIDPKDCSAHRFLGDAYESRFDDSGDKSDIDLAVIEYRAAAAIDPSKAQKDLDRVLDKQQKAAQPQ